MSVEVAVVIVGINDWERYTLPCVNSIIACEPRAGKIVVDNGSIPFYPITEKASVLQIQKTVCYAGAMNEGINYAKELDYDWCLVCNNDVLFTKPFEKFVLGLSPDYLYGFYLHEPKELGGRQYLSSWAMLISEKIWEHVGRFDESFTPMGYEDADYCFRAEELGYGLVGLIRESFGIRHLSKSRNVLPAKNLAYLKEKHGI